MLKIFRSYTFTWWQGSLLKVMLISFGIIVGILWPEFWREWTMALWAIFIISALYFGYQVLTERI